MILFVGPTVLGKTILFWVHWLGLINIVWGSIRSLDLLLDSPVLGQLLLRYCELRYAVRVICSWDGLNT